VDILSCLMGGGYTEMSGTSMATPHCSGGIAVALAPFKQEPALIEDYMKDSAQHLDGDGSYESEGYSGQDC
jgi:subtilisin family serine protease